MKPIVWSETASLEYQNLVRRIHAESPDAARRVANRIAGDTIALSPPLIVSEDEIGEIVDKVGKVLRAVG